MKHTNLDKENQGDSRAHLEMLRSKNTSQGSFLRCDSNYSNRSRSNLGKYSMTSDHTYLNMFENRKNSRSKSRLRKNESAGISVLNNDNINMLKSHKTSNVGSPKETPLQKQQLSYTKLLKKDKSRKASAQKKEDQKKEDQKKDQDLHRKIYHRKSQSPGHEDFPSSLNKTDPKLLEKLKDRLKVKDDRIKTLLENNNRTEKLKDNMLKNMQCLYDEINMQKESNQLKESESQKLNELLKSKKDEIKSLKKTINNWENRFHKGKGLPQDELDKDLLENRYSSLEVIKEYITSDDPRDHKLAKCLEDLEARDNELYNLKKDLEVYVEEITRLNKTIDNKNEENLEVLNKLKSTKDMKQSPDRKDFDDVKKLQEKIEMSNQDIQNQTQDLNNKNDQFTKLENQNECLLKDLDKKDQQIVDLQSELEKLSEKFEQLDKDLDRKNKRVSDLVLRNKKLVKDRSELKANLTTPVKNNQQDYDHKNDESMLEATLSQKEINDIINENFELKQQLDEKNRQGAGDSPSDLSKRNRRLQQQLNEARIKSGEFQRLADEIKIQAEEEICQKYEKIIEDLKNSAGKYDSNSQQDNNELDNFKRLKNNEQKNSLRTKMNEIVKLKNKVEELERQVKDQKNSGKLIDEKEELQIELKNTNAKYQILLDQIIELQNEIQNLMDELDQCNKEKQDLLVIANQIQNEKTIELTFSNNSLKSKKDEINKNIEKLLQNDAEVTSTNLELSKKFTEINKEFDKSQRSINLVQNSDNAIEILKDQKDKMNQLSKEIEDLKKLDKKNKRIVNELKSNIEDLEKEAQQINKIFENHMKEHGKETEHSKSPITSYDLKTDRADQLENEVSKLNDLYKETLDQVSDKDTEIQRLKEKLNRLEDNDNLDLKSYNSNNYLSGRASNLTKIVDKLCENDRNKEVSTMELEKKMVQLKKDYERSNRSIETSKDPFNNQLEVENQNQIDNMEELNQELNNQKQLDKKNKRIINELKANCEDLAEEALQLNKVFENQMKLGGEFHDNTKGQNTPKNDKLTDELENDYQKKIDELENQMNEIQNKLYDKADECEELIIDIERLKNKHINADKNDYTSNVSFNEANLKVTETLDKLFESEKDQQSLNRELEKKMVLLKKEYQKSQRSIASIRNLDVNNQSKEENDQQEQRMNILNEEIKGLKQIDKKNKRIINELKANCEDLAEEAAQINKIFEEHVKSHNEAQQAQPSFDQRNDKVLNDIENTYNQHLNELELNHDKKAAQLELLVSQAHEELEEQAKEREQIKLDLIQKNALSQSQYLKEIDDPKGEHQNTISELEKLYSETLEKLDQKIIECAKLSKELDKKTKDYELLEEQLDENTKNFELLNAQLNQFTKINEKLCKELVLKTNEIEKLNDDLEQKDKECEKLNDELEQKDKVKSAVFEKEKTDELNSQIDELNKTIKNKTKECYIKDLELGDLTEDYEAKIKELNQQIYDLNSGLQSEISKADDDSMKQLVELERKVSNQEKLLKNAEKKNELSDLDKATFEQKITDQQEQLSVLQIQTDEKDVIIDDLKVKIQELEREPIDLNEKISDLNNKIEVLEKTQKVLNSSESVDQYNELNAEIQRLKRVLKEERNEKFMLDTKLFKLNKTVKALEELLNENGINYEHIKTDTKGSSKKKNLRN